MTVTESHVAIERGAAPRAAVYKKLALYLGVALLLSIPCVWQEHIQAHDLSSHLYNAWLANQAAAGQLKGLYVVPQYTNVLFDLALSGLLKTGSVVLTERVAVIASVQIFFWGCFALVSAFGGRPAWGLAPFLVILAYGIVFRMGFFNFYIAVGICCGAIALVWSNHRRARWLAIPLLLLAITAHYLPCLWAVVVIGYILTARRIQPARRRWLLVAGLACLSIVAVFFVKTVTAGWAPGLHIDTLLGISQAHTFSLRYQYLPIGLFVCWIVLLVRRLETAPKALDDIALQLWLLMAAAGLCLPDHIWLPWYAGGLAFVTIRLSLLSAIFFCAAMARVPSNVLERTIHVALLAVFIFFSYGDERALNSVEDKVATALAGLPQGSRVVVALKDSRLYVPALDHIADRACIGKCFDFANYEPSVGQFRLRAKPGNGYVMADYDDIAHIEQDQLVFRRTDVDLYRVSPCGATQDFCVSKVIPGEILAQQEIQALGSTRFWGW